MLLLAMVGTTVTVAAKPSKITNHKFGESSSSTDDNKFDLFRLGDMLREVINKYIGETEPLLKWLFDTAEGAGLFGTSSV